MKAIITMRIKKVRNSITGRMVEITDELANNPQFKKSVATNTEKICSELEKYYQGKGIVCDFTYYFEDGE
jgi:hypothetical protein